MSPEIFYDFFHNLSANTKLSHIQCYVFVCICNNYITYNKYNAWRLHHSSLLDFSVICKP
ncbi:unnamed protein product [Tenebrio molitor]|nr:unnamed protein product [Tenebrio molitor]